MNSRKKITPFEIAYNKKPNVGNFRIFGSRGYKKNDKQLKGKLNPVSEPVLLLGYGFNKSGYYVYNLKSKKYETSRNCEFLEHDEHQNEKTFQKSGNTEKPQPLRKKVEDESKNEKNHNIFKLLDDNDDDDSNVEIDTDSPNVESEEQYNGKPRNFYDVHQDNVLGNDDLKRTRSNRQYLACFQNKVEMFTTPKNYTEIKRRNDFEAWDAACQKEIDKFYDVGKMKLIEKPPHVQVLPILELYNRKFDSVLGKDILKCRIVLRGDLEQNRNYETYAPVVSADVIRLFFGITAQLNWNMGQLDISSAFLYGQLDRTIYVDLPQKLKEKYGNSKCWSTKQAIYGLTDAPRAWNKKVKNTLAAFGFKSCPVEESLFVFKHQNELQIMVILYVDDILYAAKSNDLLLSFEKHIEKSFKCKTTRQIRQFVGFQVDCDEEKIKLHQTAYVEKMVKTFELEKSSVYTTPMESMLVLENTGKRLESPKLYQSLVGALLYANQRTRPEISYSINQLSKYGQNPSYTHLKYGKRVLQYLKGSKEYGLLFKKKADKLNIKFYVDSEFGRHSEGKSIYGFVGLINDVPFTWKTKQLARPSLSSTESEFKAISESFKHIMFVNNVLTFIGINYNKIEVFNDNQGAIKIAKNNLSAKRTRHIQLRHFHVKDVLERDDVKLEFVKGDLNLADTFTKSLGRKKFMEFRDQMLKL